MSLRRCKCIQFIANSKQFCCFFVLWPKKFHFRAKSRIFAEPNALFKGFNRRREFTKKQIEYECKCSFFSCVDTHCHCVCHRTFVGVTNFAANCWMPIKIRQADSTLHISRQIARNAILCGYFNVIEFDISEFPKRSIKSLVLFFRLLGYFRNSGIDKVTEGFRIGMKEYVVMWAIILCTIFRENIIFEIRFFNAIFLTILCKGFAKPFEKTFDIIII